MVDVRPPQPVFALADELADAGKFCATIARAKTKNFVQRERSKILPDVPTVSESGVHGYESCQWFGLLTPKNTPVEIVTKLHQAVVAALKTEKVANWIRTEAGTPVGNSPLEFAKEISDDVEKWTDVAKAAGVERR
jgi:tripartite-type tricarboxylate transporter receptor subunit TctC